MVGPLAKATELGRPIRPALCLWYGYDSRTMQSWLAVDSFASRHAETEEETEFVADQYAFLSRSARTNVSTRMRRSSRIDQFAM